MSRPLTSTSCAAAQASNCILLFVKLPMAGHVKTRLAVEIGEEAAAGLYKCFVEDLISTVEQSGAAFRLCFYPPEVQSHFQRWHDVDARADLEDLAARNENTSFGLSRTLAFMRKTAGQSLLG